MKEFIVQIEKYSATYFSYSSLRFFVKSLKKKEKKRVRVYEVVEPGKWEQFPQEEVERLFI
jgi:hypothetical protein